MHLFYELIQVAIGNREQLSMIPNEKEWNELFEISQEQAVVGITFEALDALATRGQKLPTSLFFEWIGLAEQIKHQNLLMNKRCCEATKMFTDAGIKTCILKGQGNTRMYPNSLLRQSGDIDIWLDAPKDEIVAFVQKQYPEAEETSHHIDYPVFDDIVVEVHFAPGYSMLRRFQKRLEKYIESRRNKQFCHSIELQGTSTTINVPTDDFNIVLQLSHMQRHFFYGGIGIRHIVDFYYLLKQAHGNVDVLEMKKIIKDLGLWKFTCGIMWIISSTLGLDNVYLITDTDKKRGLFILKEIMKTGNFGQYEQRGFRKIAQYSFTLSVILHNFRMLWLFPEEAIFAPIDGVIRKYIIKN